MHGLDLGQSLMSQRWYQPGVRRVAEEAIISCARLVRAFANLDWGGAEAAAGTRAEAACKGAGHQTLPPPPPAPSRAESKRRRRDERPPRIRRRPERAPDLRPKSRSGPPRAEEEDERFSENRIHEFMA